MVVMAQRHKLQRHGVHGQRGRVVARRRRRLEVGGQGREHEGRVDDGLEEGRRCRAGWGARGSGRAREGHARRDEGGGYRDEARARRGHGRQVERVGRARHVVLVRREVGRRVDHDAGRGRGDHGGGVHAVVDVVLLVLVVYQVGARVGPDALVGVADGEGLNAVDVEAEVVDPVLQAAQREAGRVGAVCGEGADLERVVVADAGAERGRVGRLVADGACTR